MMSLDAAALLAQVLPVGVFVLVLESRRGISFISRKTRAGRVLTIAYWLLFTLASLGGINATAFCIGAVVTDSPPSEAMSGIIVVLSYIVFLGLAAFTTLLAFSESGVLEMVAESAQETRVRRAALKAARQGRHEAE
ncbi:di/tricarboxylate transporter [Clavibacter michiganensis]|uniref:hypothetical protein n=1 Tax=Clavibacter michiganensis TaxID=28447 RepID=UPI00195AC1FA|nr:hypothetical protein [Clavibacter michiganensis]MBM7411330.1 di/tricarboxylate transporter [Clavibacter michiganensis]